MGSMAVITPHGLSKWNIYNFRSMTFNSFNHLHIGYKWSTRVNEKLVQKDISEDQWVAKYYATIWRLSLIKEFQILVSYSNIKQSKIKYIARIAQLMWRSKNLGSTDTNRWLSEKKGGMPTGASPSLDAWDFLKYYIGMPWASPSLTFCVSLILLISRFS